MPTGSRMVKAAPLLARKAVLESAAEMIVGSNVVTTPRFVIFEGVMPDGPFRESVPITKSVMRSTLGKSEKAREEKENVSEPPSPVSRSLALVALSVLALTSPITWLEEVSMLKICKGDAAARLPAASATLAVMA